jgi:hypothetical protein
MMEQTKELQGGMEEDRCGGITEETFDTHLKGLCE